MRRMLLLLSVIMPQFIKQTIYRKLMRWQIGSNVSIGLSYIDSSTVTIGNDVKIGHFNIIRGIKRLSVGDGTYIANLNQMFGASYPNWASELMIGKRVNFMSRHFIDVGGVVSIGDGAVIGGRDTQFWSHTRTIVSGPRSLQASSVRIGVGVYVGARATLVGCDIPDRAVIGAGSVVTKSFEPEPCTLLIAGNPATIRRRYDSAEIRTMEEKVALVYE